MLVARTWRGDGELMGSLLLNGRGFSFRVMKIFWHQIGVVVYHTVNVLNAPELFTLKWFVLLCKFHIN